MISSKEKDVINAAEILQMQIIYNGEILDTSLDSLRAYREGTQSLTYLDSSVHLAYALLRLLEKCSKGSSNGLVRKKKAARSMYHVCVCVSFLNSFPHPGKRKTDDSAVPDVEEEPAEEEEEVTETTFTFDAFEQVTFFCYSDPLTIAHDHIAVCTPRRHTDFAYIPGQV